MGQWESGQFPKIYNSIIMDLHIKLEHNFVCKIRCIFKGYLLIMYPCVAFIVALLVGGPLSFFLKNKMFEIFIFDICI